MTSLQTPPTITLSVEFDGLTAGSRTKQAASELHDDLSRRLPEALAAPDGPSDGEKGIETDLLNIAIALINAGAVTQLVNSLKSFLARDKRRSLTLRTKKGVTITNAHGEVLRIDASNVGDEVVIEAIKAAAGLPAS